MKLINDSKNLHLKCQGMSDWSFPPLVELQSTWTPTWSRWYPIKTQKISLQLFTINFAYILPSLKFLFVSQGQEFFHHTKENPIDFNSLMNLGSYHNNNKWLSLITEFIPWNRRTLPASSIKFAVSGSTWILDKSP